MLTSEHAIIEYRDGQAFPDRLTQKAHRHYVDHAERMLVIYREGIGRQRRWLHRDIEAVFADEPDCPIRRIEAFCKLLDDASVFQGDSFGKSAKLRLDVFSRAASLHPLVRQPDRLFEHEEQATKTRIAEELATPWDQIEQALYADVTAFQTLEEFTSYPTAAAFLSRYNVAQLQACLYRAESMTVVATEDLKTIVRYAKFARLLHEIARVGPSKYRITFSGPASVLRETRRYGVDFAKFLPALLACKGWTMTAALPTPWRTRATLAVSAEDGFTSHLPATQEFDSAMEESFAKKFGLERDGWHLIREGEILHDRQKTFVPDFTFRHDDGTGVLLEIVGFWTPEYLAAKRETLRQFRHNRILLAVPESSLREGAAIGEHVLVYKTVLRLPPLLAALEAARGSRAETPRESASHE
jgi:predicted nuclease of restriction endonuclease-like RecB superfamily